MYRAIQTDVSEADGTSRQKLHYARRTLREHRQQPLHDDLEVVVRRLCADVRHAPIKHPEIFSALVMGLLHERFGRLQDMWYRRENKEEPFLEW
jgi:hypothetical protein